jgi:4-hydroxythreonine-4-phosphate dehydrogenase
MGLRPSPPLALTMGESAGIGTECTVKAWQRLRAGGVRFFLLDDPDRVRKAAAALGHPIAVAAIRSPREAAACFGEALPVLAVEVDGSPRPGRPESRHARSVVASIETAVTLARRGEASGVVTNPIQKSALYETGFEYPGHTEFLAALTGAPRSVMMLACPQLRVVPVTVHVALRDAIASLTTGRIVEDSVITAAALRDMFGIASPRLAVAGLNPHAGEDGAMGDEERRLIAPAIALLRARGIDASGPFPPDTLFTSTMRTTYDAAICMYHDQALIPLKTLDMDGGVNVTLGLPIIRTSPDHGTALDIAGKGVANPASLIAAIEMAWKLATKREVETIA